MHRFKIGEVVAVKGNGSLKLGKIFEIGRKNKAKVFSVLMENGTVHTHLRVDAPNSMYYIDSNASKIIQKNVE